MTLQIYDMPQGSDEWFQVRMGIPTASEFATVLAKGQGLTRKTYMLKLAGERLTGVPMESYTNGHIERGKEMEAEAREIYAMAADVELTEVGFIRRGDIGCSPDRLIGDDGGIEVKTTLPHLLIGLLLRDKFPPAHRAQVQGTLLVTGRKWLDLVVYWPGLPLFVKRAYRDEEYIADLRTELAKFNDELDDVVQRVRMYGQSSLKADLHKAVEIERRANA